MWQDIRKYGFRTWLIHHRSPIRWGLFALLVAVMLFGFEIFLSLSQIYLELYGGVKVGQAVGIAITIFIYGFGALSLIALGLCIYAVVNWKRNKSRDDTLAIVRGIQKDIDVVKRDIKRIKGGGNRGRR